MFDPPWRALPAALEPSMMYAFCCLLATALAFRGPASQVAPARAAPLLRGAVEDHVTRRAEDLLMAIVKDKTALGTDIKRNNQRTGGSAVLEGVTDRKSVV